MHFVLTLYIQPQIEVNFWQLLCALQNHNDTKD